MNNPVPFDEDDAKDLLEFGLQIMEIDPDSVTEAWESWARTSDVSSCRGSV